MAPWLLPAEAQPKATMDGLLLKVETSGRGVGGGPGRGLHVRLSGQRAGLLLRWSEFESRQSLLFSFC